MILLIDNYDSFTWNLVQRIGELDPTADVRVVRNDCITPAEARQLAPSHVIISPGPCSPSEAGVSNDIIRSLAGSIPILGVCLGHQCIGHTSGMTVARHTRVMHGKTSDVFHDGKGIYRGVPSPFTATRYHSLVVLRETVPAEGWEVSAWTRDVLDDGREVDVVMGLRRVATRPGEPPLEGVQFHPESFLTVEGPRLLANFLGLPSALSAQTAETSAHR
ncbi:MAG: aminodeoxychorismate/anthranilate synthase component II [Planctomycetota bacterium]|nr:aminodeoxychorismate/anthranilate synthase component II [Planctomycetota bacterium]